MDFNETPVWTYGSPNVGATMIVRRLSLRSLRILTKCVREDLHLSYEFETDAIDVTLDWDASNHGRLAMRHRSRSVSPRLLGLAALALAASAVAPETKADHWACSGAATVPLLRFPGPRFVDLSGFKV